MTMRPALTDDKIEGGRIQWKTCGQRAAAKDQPGRVRKRRIHDTVVDRLTIIERERKCHLCSLLPGHLCAKQGDPPNDTTSSCRDNMGVSITRARRWSSCSKETEKYSKLQAQSTSILSCKLLLTAPISGHSYSTVLAQQFATAFSTTSHTSTDKPEREHTKSLRLSSNIHPSGHVCRSRSAANTTTHRLHLRHLLFFSLLKNDRSHNPLSSPPSKPTPLSPKPPPMLKLPQPLRLARILM